MYVIIFFAVLEGDFLTAYFASFGNLNRLLRGGNGLLNGLLGNLRNRIDFTPGDDEDDEMPTLVVATASATATATGGGAVANAGARASAGGNGNGRFSVRGLLGSVVSRVASATVSQYAGQGNATTALCIRQVINVRFLIAYSLSLPSPSPFLMIRSIVTTNYTPCDYINFINTGSNSTAKNGSAGCSSSAD